MRVKIYTENTKDGVVYKRPGGETVPVEKMAPSEIHEVLEQLNRLEDLVNSGILISTCLIEDEEIKFFTKHNKDVRAEMLSYLLRQLKEDGEKYCGFTSEEEEEEEEE